ncbi:DUF1152 domain-containing protein [Nocardia fluminea]
MVCRSLSLSASGTDLLMTGDEAGLGTPVEDVTSLLAAAALDIPVELAVCVGFGVDAFHGVCHAHFLENVAALAKAGAYHGVFALTPGIPAVGAWLDVVSWVLRHTPGRESIVSASITDAARGEFGDHHSLDRTRAVDAELFINPLMPMVWDSISMLSPSASAIAVESSMPPADSKSPPPLRLSGARYHCARGEISRCERGQQVTPPPIRCKI